MDFESKLRQWLDRTHLQGHRLSVLLRHVDSLLDLLDQKLQAANQRELVKVEKILGEYSRRIKLYWEGEVTANHFQELQALYGELRPGDRHKLRTAVRRYLTAQPEVTDKSIIQGDSPIAKAS